MDRIDMFKDEFRFLSNFHPSPVRLTDDEFPDTYPTVEHAYQAAKTLGRKMRKRIRDAETPGRAKQLGGTAVLRPAWDDIKLNVMRDLVWQKFTEDPDLRAKLLATGDAELVEGNTWGDTFWGVDLDKGRGENHLGKILMETRQKIVDHHHAVLFAKRVAPEFDLFEDMLKRAHIEYRREVPVKSDNIELTVESADGDGSTVVTFNRNGQLLSIEGYGY